MLAILCYELCSLSGLCVLPSTRTLSLGYNRKHYSYRIRELQIVFRCVCIVVQGERDVSLTSLHRRTSSWQASEAARSAKAGSAPPVVSVLRLVGLQGDASATPSSVLTPSVTQVMETVELTVLATLPKLKTYERA